MRLDANRHWAVLGLAVVIASLVPQVLYFMQVAIPKPASTAPSSSTQHEFQRDEKGLQVGPDMSWMYDPYVDDRRLKASDGVAISSGLRELTEGRMSYNTPNSMKTGQKERVIAKIGTSEVSAGALREGFTDKKSFSSETVNTQVSVKMKVKLIGPDFEVVPLTSEEQIVSGKSPTQWEWMISPKVSGKLHLTLDTVAELAGTGRDFTVIERDVAVSVDPNFALEEFGNKNWQWILTTIAGGVALFWKFYGPKEPAKSDAATVPSSDKALAQPQSRPSQKKTRQKRGGRNGRS